MINKANVPDKRWPDQEPSKNKLDHGFKNKKWWIHGVQATENQFRDYEADLARATKRAENST